MVDLSSTAGQAAPHHPLDMRPLLSGATRSIVHGEFECEQRLITLRRPLVSVVDDEQSVRESLPDLLKQLGYSTRTSSSAEDFLASGCIAEILCLIVDVRVPTISGLDLERSLLAARSSGSQRVITAHADETVHSRTLVPWHACSSRSATRR
jgi:CheY-like chemotaxis protein